MLEYIVPVSYTHLEYIGNDKGLNVIVDFAHTPRAFEEIFKTLPEDKKKIAVFGIQGDRNAEFRNLIGKTVSDYGIYAIVTTDAVSYTHLDVYKRQIKDKFDFVANYK